MWLFIGSIMASTIVRNAVLAARTSEGQRSIGAATGVSAN